MTKTPVSLVPELQFSGFQSSQPSTTRNVTQTGAPREEEHDQSIGSVSPRGALNCRPGLLRSKANHILEQMVSFCNHQLQGHRPTSAQRLAETGREKEQADEEEEWGKRKRRRARVLMNIVKVQKVTCLSPMVNASVNRCLSQRRD